jgi:hypothetical protein
MTIRGIIWTALMVAGSIVAAVLTLVGLYNGLRVDLREDSLLTGLYCLLPLLVSPVFFLVRPTRRAALLLVIMACGFLVVYSALNWRTCSELGYCASVGHTVLQTLGTRSVMAFFCVACIALIVGRLNDHRSAVRKQKQDPEL